MTSSQGRKVQIYFYLHLLKVYHLFRRDYRDKYERTRDGRRQSTKIDDRAEGHHGGRPAADSHRRWFPEEPKSLVYLRALTTIYMIYVIVKILIPEQIGFVLRLAGLSKPVHCYLAGRFRMSQRINGYVALILSSFHLLWRLNMFCFSGRRRVASNAIYFMLLSDKELDDFYDSLEDEKLVKAEQQSKGVNQSSTPNPILLRSRRAKRGDGLKPVPLGRARLIQDVMYYRVDQFGGRTTFALRPNRTRAASTDLNHYLAHVTSWTLVVFLALAVGITIALLVTSLTNERYLRDYPNCDPYLEQLRRGGDLREWWRLNPFRHQTIAFLFDTLENAIIWLESGLNSAFFVGFAFTFNYDNLLYWTPLKRSIASHLQQARNRRRQQLICSVGELSADGFRLSSPTGTGKDEWSRSIYDLQMQFCDFIGQLSQSNRVITDLVSMALSIWFVLFAAFIYDMVTQKQRGFPLELCLALLFALSVVSSMWMVLLVLHRRCVKSYAPLCSLMALDWSGRKNRFIHTLDYYCKRRICYTVYRGQPITATSYVTIIGYTFSIFFVIASTSNRGR